MDQDERRAQLIRSARRAKGWSQDELARRMGGSTTRQTVSRWENPQSASGHGLAVDRLQKLAELLDIPMHALVAADADTTRDVALTEDEELWLRLYRALAPADRPRVVRAVQLMRAYQRDPDLRLAIPDLTPADARRLEEALAALLTD